MTGTPGQSKPAQGGAASGPTRWGPVFLDRDGVINRRRVGDWVRTPEQLELLPGALDAIARLTRAGRSPVVVTNQSGIGRGTMTRADVDQVNAYLTARVERAGGRLRGILVCPHAPNDACACRKPGIAMFEQAATAWGLDLTRATMIGDAASDVEAARRAGFANALLVTDPVEPYPASAPAPDREFASLAEAVDWLLSKPM
ncbi:MAG: HAD family hydrolase [Deltaproteobacteria bacterium]|nr:HAD family hydrolase [Deltaproteobacteria bacterium]